MFHSKSEDRHERHVFQNKVLSLEMSCVLYSGTPKNMNAEAQSLEVKDASKAKEVPVLTCTDMVI